jgi:hypothetical protein
MATLHNDVFDLGLTKLDTDVNALHITSQEATTYAEATSTYTLGNKATPTISAPADRSGGGRKVTVSAITDGTVTATATATHYALVDTATSRLLATGELDASQAVTNGNPFTLTAFAVGIPDPA